MQTFEVKGFTFRIKKMNMIELLAIQSQINFDSVENTMKLYNVFLERIEVQIADKWLQVKDKDVFYPNDVENDLEMMQALISHFLAYIKSVFLKSNE